MRYDLLCCEVRFGRSLGEAGDGGGSIGVYKQSRGLSVSSRRAVPLRDYVNTISNDVTLVFVVGAMAHGNIDSDYTDDFISVSNYPLSAGTCLAQICTAVERHWNIL
ncbi:hypothetical protein RJ639_038373 [Escallonia herrerae]|uniref:Ribosomal RNA small subunit methyltransferase NEP1 n=1 Tax=Escallonia herrerae TaxID=1293975 RepID=A0AA88WRW6_9ASTE|nr:hypothetical protein RJ639_038373 [Escallonia herrerae]